MAAPAPRPGAPSADAGAFSPGAGPTIDPDTLVRDSRNNCSPSSQVAAEAFVASPSDPIAQPPAPLLSRTAIVRFQFATGGTYMGQYTSSSTYAVFAPKCAPLRQWRLEGVFASGIVGEIDIPYGAVYAEGGAWCNLHGSSRLERLATN